MVVTTVDVAISSQGTNKPRNASVSLFVDLRVYFYTFPSGCLSSGKWTAEGTERTAKRLRVTNMTGLLLASFFLDIQLTILVLVISREICLKEGEIITFTRLTVFFAPASFCVSSIVLKGDRFTSP